MKNCPNLQKSLDWCEGTPQYPGIRRRLYYINKNLIELWPTLERDDFGRVIDAHYLGAFTIAADAAWQYIDINIDKSTVTSEPQGEVPSQTQLNKATFVHNGIDAEATAAAGYLNNADCVFVYEDMIGHFRVLGNNKWRTKITVNQDQGQGTNPASTTINIEVTDMIAPPFYVEGLETEDGEVFPSYDDDALLEPRLTSPSGNTFDIGTIPADGSTVSKTMRIKGSNLTESLTLTKSGTGLTISKSSITAEEANAGIDITLTYSKSKSGAGSLNGSLIIASKSEVNKTISITAKKAALTSPSDSTIDVGTIASDGSSVQKSITVQGTNLSKAVSLRVTGNGFSLSKSSLSASQVNNGAAVIVYYNNSSQGPASATGSLVISSDEVNKTIELTAAKAAPAAQPQLSLPTEGTIDMGTIPSDETSVQVYVPIKGVNLTEPLSISINMKGFSVSASTISVQQANAGSGVFVTYQNSLEGPATAQATLTIASNEVRKQVTMTAAKAAQHDTIDDYIQDGLIFHLDGINKGEVENQWTDLIGGVDFPNHGAVALENGWQFNGAEYMGYIDTSKSLLFNGDECTIEVCFEDTALNQGAGSHDAGMFLVGLGASPAKGSNAQNAIYVNTVHNNNGTKYINGVYVGTSDSVWMDNLIDTIAKNTLSMNKSVAVHNGTELETLGANHWANVKGGRTIGAQWHSNSGLTEYATGKIFSIRVYNKLLTKAEMIHNQHVDNVRFSLGLTLPEEEEDDSV
jgi:hypothetical protein